MTDRPAVANWLAGDEKNWLESRLDEERTKIDSVRRLSLWQALADRRGFALLMMYFTSVTAKYWVVFFMPQIVKGMNLSNQMTGFVTAVPYIVGSIGLLAWGYSSDRLRERRWHLVVASLLAGAGLICAGWFGSSYWALLGMAMATTG